MTLPGTATPAQLLYPDMAQELACTRKMIALVPDGNDDFRPHLKSMALESLATHLVELPTFASTILTTDELDWAKTPWAPKKFSKTSDRLEQFDKNAAAMTSVVEGASWDALAKRWVMRAGDQIYVDDLKAKLLRSFALNHMAHHRAQLGVYLRLLDVAIPGTYGPSADEM
jgi:uncharacterized damage-inducible protein DinB